MPRTLACHTLTCPIRRYSPRKYLDNGESPHPITSQRGTIETLAPLEEHRICSSPSVHAPNNIPQNCFFSIRASLRTDSRATSISARSTVVSWLNRFVSSSLTRRAISGEPEYPHIAKPFFHRTSLSLHS